MQEATHRGRRFGCTSALVAVAVAVVVGCGGSDDEGPTASDCYDAVEPLGRYAIVDGLYQAGAVTTGDIQAAADTVGLSDSDFANYFGEGSDFPSYDAVMANQRLFDVIVTLAYDTGVANYRDLYEQACQDLVDE